MPVPDSSRHNKSRGSPFTPAGTLYPSICRSSHKRGIFDDNGDLRPVFVQLTHREIQSLAQLDRTSTALPVSHLFQYFRIERRHREYAPPFQSLRCFNSLFQNNSISAFATSYLIFVFLWSKIVIIVLIFWLLTSKKNLSEVSIIRRK